MSKIYIGCIDGKVLFVQPRKKEVVLSIGREKARLSGEAASLLANHLNLKPRHQPPVATPTSGAQTRARSSPPPLEIDPDVTVADLIKVGLLEVRDVITMKYGGKTHRAAITHGGYFDVYGRTHESPSGAAGQVTRAPTNGWTAWKVADGRNLHDLRNHFQWMREADRFPGEDHRYAASTQREKQRLAQKWVRYALDRDQHPGEFDEQAVERFLSGNRYSENTLSTYRTHLDQWFSRFDPNT